MVTVNKGGNNKDVRITSDLSPLNKYVVPVRHPKPPIADTFLQRSGATHYSKLDLRKGFFQIQLAEIQKKLTATLIPNELMAYNRLPMGM